MSIRDLLTHNCTVARPTKTNTDGEFEHSFSDVATGVPCLIQEGRGEVRFGETGESLVYDATAFFLPSQDVRPRGQHDQSDRLLMTHPASFNGIKFTCLAVVDESGQEHHLTAYLRRLAAK